MASVCLQQYYSTDGEYTHKTWPEKINYSTLSLNQPVIMPA